jgi:hypothetical protein
VIEPNDNELPGQTNAANGRTRSTKIGLGVPDFDLGFRSLDDRYMHRRETPDAISPGPCTRALGVFVPLTGEHIFIEWYNLRRLPGSLR